MPRVPPRQRAVKGRCPVTKRYTKTRNALTSERVDKLLYIQINYRTLRREGFQEEEEEEDDIITDTDDDAIFLSPSHTTEA